jgi:uncharacterized membrane protein YgcG
MGKASTSVASGHYAKVASYPSVRSHLTTGGAFASAGILALSLVAAPPDFHGARTEVRAVQLATFALPSAAPSGALLEKFISNHAQSAVPVAGVAAGSAADIATAIGTTPLALDPATDPAINRQQVNNAALAPTTTAYDWTQDPILGPIISFALGVLLVLPAAVLVVLACSVCALFNVVSSWIRSIFADLTPLPAASGASTATADPSATTTRTSTSDPRLSNSVPATATTAGPANAAPAIKIGKADVSPPVTSTDTPTRTKQVTSTGTATSMEDVTETVETNEASTGPTAVNAPQPSAGAFTSGPAKPTVRPATPRPAVRGSLGVGEQLRDLPHRGNGVHPTTQTAAAGHGAATAGSSSVGSSSAASSSTGSNSSGGGSSGGGHGS